MRKNTLAAVAAFLIGAGPILASGLDAAPAMLAQAGSGGAGSGAGGAGGAGAGGASSGGAATGPAGRQGGGSTSGSPSSGPGGGSSGVRSMDRGAMRDQGDHGARAGRMDMDRGGGTNMARGGDRDRAREGMRGRSNYARSGYRDDRWRRRHYGRVYVEGSRCRTVIERKYYRRHMVVRRIKRCW